MVVTIEFQEIYFERHPQKYNQYILSSAYPLLSSASFGAFSPASREILGYNPAVTKGESSGMSFKFFVLFIKSFESFI